MSKNDHFGRDCYEDTPKTGRDFSSGETSSDKAKKATNADTADQSVLALGRRCVCLSKAPIIFEIDVTGSNIEFARIFYDKVKTFSGQIMYPGKTIEQIEQIEKGKLPMDVIPYLNSFEIVQGYVGDATCDRYPLQYSDPVRGAQLFEWIQKMKLEGRGGDGLCESFELGALRALEYTDFSNAQFPFYFLACDEMPYPNIKMAEVRKYLDGDFNGKVTSAEVYRGLFQKFQGKAYILLNPYHGRYENGKEKHPKESFEIYEAWKKVIPSEFHDHIIRLRSEKSFVDVMLGIISRVSGVRNKASYTADMISKRQDEERVNQVNEMLAFLDDKEACLTDLPKGSPESYGTGTERL